MPIWKASLTQRKVDCNIIRIRFRRAAWRPFSSKKRLGGPNVLKPKDTVTLPSLTGRPETTRRDGARSQKNTTTVDLTINLQSRRLKWPERTTWSSFVIRPSKTFSMAPIAGVLLLAISVDSKKELKDSKP